MQQKTKIQRGIISLALFGLAASLAPACPNPVFHYALRYWDADPYQVVARGAEAWPAGPRAALGILQDAERSGRANLRVRLEPAATHAGPAAASAAPLLEVSFPDAGGVQRPVWSGEPSAEAARRLLDSPARAEIGRLLAQGKTAVWVLLESGNRGKDSAAAGLLQKELRRLETVLAASEPEPWGGPGGPGWGPGGPPESPPVSFGFVRVRRDDPAEAMLVRMLLSSKPDLDKISGETIAFPVYGRGLVLEALVGSALEPQRIGAVGEFLTGPCSCVFKESWHGVSLLLSVDWNSGPDAVQDKTTPAGAPVSAGGFLRRMEQQGTNAPAPAKEDAKP